MSTVSLYNRRRGKALVLNLPYRECGDISLCERQLRAKVSIDTTGRKRLAKENARLSRSITLRPKGKKGDSLAGLPRSVLKAPEVANAIAAGDVRVVEVDTPLSAQAEEVPEKTGAPSAGNKAAPASKKTAGKAGEKN